MKKREEDVLKDLQFSDIHIRLGNQFRSSVVIWSCAECGVLFQDNNGRTT